MLLNRAAEASTKADVSPTTALRSSTKAEVAS